MAECLQMLFFLFKSKYRRKYLFGPICIFVVFLSSTFIDVVLSANCTSLECVNGVCVNGTNCVCFDGWQGPSCQFCGGKVRLTEWSGIIHDGPGNYSKDVKCSWLVLAGTGANATIRLHMEEFATECGWDHLYIFDGDSIDSPLLAVFSGLMYKDGYSIRRVPEVVAKSGSALLHFYSDIAYNMTGFNISYRVNACPSRYSWANCTGHGVCIDGVCTCDGSWLGEACDRPVCPHNCTHPQGYCDREKHRCHCLQGYTGEDCSQQEALGYWEAIRPQGFLPEGSASHGAVVFKDSLYIIGGEDYNRGDNMNLYLYDLNGNVWETRHLETKSPRPRYGHSVVIFGDKIYMYGGVEKGGHVTNELWSFDISTRNWENITVRTTGPCILGNEAIVNSSLNFNGTLTQPPFCGPMRTAGHTSTVIFQEPARMVVIFGHSPLFGYLNIVQEYLFGASQWSVVSTRGYPVRGGYGHSASWDPLTKRIYVYGGFVAENPSSSKLSKEIFAYEPYSRTWTKLTSAPTGRTLHTGTFVTPGMLVVFGGNTHNDTLQHQGARCYSRQALAYDVKCDQWHALPLPRHLGADLARFGHSAVTFQGRLYIYGGFDGQMLADILVFTPGQCHALKNQTTCLNQKIGTKCVWDWQSSRCMSIDYTQHMDVESLSMIRMCPEESRTAMSLLTERQKELCSLIKECHACIQTSYGCVWCGSNLGCSLESCSEATTPSSNLSPFLHNNHSEPQIYTTPKVVKRLEECPSSLRLICEQQSSCHSCFAHPFCYWDVEPSCRLLGNVTAAADPLPCNISCSLMTNCQNCTMHDCIWCQNEGRCIDKNAYTTSFPYGQCREWTINQSRCRSPASGKSSCTYYVSCAECSDDPACGWCDDGTGTGKGSCMPGGNMGPDPRSEHRCTGDLWYFTSCPMCQCNGHQRCINGTNVCEQPCWNKTRGAKCDMCQPGHFGNPINGGKCSPCECNEQATECVPETGRCYCTTKGMTGDHCERCDTNNHYQGDPTNHGSCFYDLTIDYQFTFNLSKREDRHFTKINFKNSPPKPDIDADFSVTCSVPAKINITYKTANNPEKSLVDAVNCTSYKKRLSKTEHVFGAEDNITYTTFYVYVYDFQPPLWIQISFSQHHKLNLQQFFITFSSCFLLLLLAAAILWKIKQKYDMYRRRQRLFVEMEQMASRPFSQVLVEIERREKLGPDLSPNLPSAPNNISTSGDTTAVVVTDSTAASPAIVGSATLATGTTTLRKRKKDSPSPIALEPCCGNRAAVLSLLIRLPTGGETHTPLGQSAGLAIASALVTLGNPRKPSGADPTAGGKSDGKGKAGGRKGLTSQHPDSCI